MHFMKSETFLAQASTILYEQNGLSICVLNQADQRAIKLLQQTTYGTKGVRYRQISQVETIQRLHNPSFFHLYDHHELIGFYCLDQRFVSFPSNSLPGYYGRYLAVREDMQGKGYGQLLKSTAVKYIERTAPAPCILYSYIEAKNTRSMAASVKESFTSVARLNTYMFRRFSPVKDKRFRPISLMESNAILALVKGQYAHFGFQNFININYKNQYFILEEDGQVLAGVQANPILWKILQIPSPFGALAKHIAPYIPGFRRFFNPSRQAFVVLEGVYVDPTKPELLSVLLESVLAHFNLHTAMWQIDKKDPLVPLLASPTMGRFSHFQPGVITHVMVKPVGNLSEIDFCSNPAYVSCFDYS